MLYKIWSRFLTWFGDLYFATEPPKVKAKHIREALDVVQVGDVICRKYCYYLDSYFIKGEYSHSGVVVTPKMMYHSVAEGVSPVDIIDFIKDADGFCIVRFPEIKATKASNRAIVLIGKAYDFFFNRKDKSAFYCHEFTAECLSAGGITIVPQGKIIYADDIISKGEIVYESH